jgi:hypothetical protein
MKVAGRGCMAAGQYRSTITLSNMEVFTLDGDIITFSRLQNEA